MQLGDVPATYADVGHLMQDVGLMPSTQAAHSRIPHVAQNQLLLCLDG